MNKIQHETALKADSFLVTARGTANEIACAKTIILLTANPSLLTANRSRLDVHADTNANEPIGHVVNASA